MFLSRSYIDPLRSDAWRIPNVGVRAAKSIDKSMAGVWVGTTTLTDALADAFRVPEEELEARFGMDTSLSLSLIFMDSGGVILRRQG